MCLYVCCKNYAKTSVKIFIKLCGKCSRDGLLFVWCCSFHFLYSFFLSHFLLPYFQPLSSFFFTSLPTLYTYSFLGFIILSCVLLRFLLLSFVSFLHFSPFLCSGFFIFSQFLIFSTLIFLFFLLGFVFFDCLLLHVLFLSPLSRLHSFLPFCALDSLYFYFPHILQFNLFSFYALFC